MSTSAFGDAVLLLVLSMWVKTLTGSNGQAGLTFLFMMLPSLIAPLLGVWIDRVRRKPLLWGNLASAAILLPLLAVQDAADVWVVWVVAFLYGVSFVVLPAGVNGLLKELLPDDTLVDANAALQTTKESFRLFGPLLGAALFAWLGGGAVALVDAASFVVAALLVAGIPAHEDRPVREQTQVWHQVSAGVRHIAADPPLRHTLAGFGLMLLVVVVGGLASSRVIRRIGEVATCALGMILLAMPMGIFAASSSLAVMLAPVTLVGLSLPLLFVSVMTLVQRRTPQAIIGRVSTAVEVVMGLPQAVSLAVGALLVTLVSWRVIFALIASVTLLGAAYIVVALRGQLGAGPAVE